MTQTALLSILIIGVVGGLFLLYVELQRIYKSITSDLTRIKELLGKE